MAAEKLKIDPTGSHISFSVKKLGLLTIKGDLYDFEGQITFDKNDVNNSSFDVCVSAASINTGSQKRDEHLKSEDFFFAKEHPNICFQSSAIRLLNGQYTALGRLLILDLSKEIEIPFEYKDGVFSGQFSLNRSDYGLGKKFPSFVVGKQIQVSINCKTK